MLKITDCEIWKRLQRSPSPTRWIHGWKAVGSQGRSDAKKNNWYLDNRDCWLTTQQSLKTKVCLKAIYNRAIKISHLFYYLWLYFIAFQVLRVWSMDLRRRHYLGAWKKWKPQALSQTSKWKSILTEFPRISKCTLKVEKHEPTPAFTSWFSQNLWELFVSSL